MSMKAVMIRSRGMLQSNPQAKASLKIPSSRVLAFSFPGLPFALFSIMADPLRIRDLSLPQLESWFASLGEKPFRARQVYQWLWQKGAETYAEMTNLSKTLRQRLEQETTLTLTRVQQTTPSPAGTSKSLTGREDGRQGETVLIPDAMRMTVGLSSKVGCSLD